MKLIPFACVATLLFLVAAVPGPCSFDPHPELDCADGSACPSGTACGADGFCKPTGGAPTTGDGGSVKPADAGPVNSGCNPGDCPSGQVCDGTGACVSACNTSNCPGPNNICVNDTCQPACSSETCASPNVCQAGSCVPPAGPTSCSSTDPHVCTGGKTCAALLSAVTPPFVFQCAPPATNTTLPDLPCVPSSTNNPCSGGFCAPTSFNTGVCIAYCASDADCSGNGLCGLIYGDTNPPVHGCLDLACDPTQPLSCDGSGFNFCGHAEATACTSGTERCIFAACLSGLSGCPTACDPAAPNCANCASVQFSDACGFATANLCQ